MSEWERMRERLLEFYPEVAHLLSDPNKIMAIHGTKWPFIAAYIEATTLAEIRQEPLPDWLNFKHGGNRVVTRNSGQTALVI